MADNVTANAGSGGATFATISTSFSGDTANFAGSFIVLATGSEGSWTVTQLAGGAGSVSAGVPRVTLASDDPAVTALQILDNCISGNEAQVDVVGALPAGTNNIGDVDVLTVPADPFGANADAASATGSISAKLRFIASTGIPITGTTTVSGSVTANAGTNLNTSALALESGGNLAAIATSLAILDDWDSSDACKVVQATASNLNATVVGTGTFVVQATCTNGGTFAVQVDGSALTALQLIDNIVHVDDAAFTLGTHSGVMMMGFAGTQSVDANDACALACSTAGALHTAVQSLPASTNTIEVVGDAAHDAAIAGNPVRAAGRALTSNYTAVAAGDTADLITTILGKLVVQQYALPGTTWSYASANGGVTDTADDEAKAAGGAGVRQYVSRVQAINGHATTSTEVVIKTASTVLWRGWAQAAGGGVAATFDPPLRGGDNEAINVANITNSSQTYFNLQGYTAAE